MAIVPPTLVEVVTYPSVEVLLVRGDDGLGDWEVPLTQTYVGKVDPAGRAVEILTLYLTYAPFGGNIEGIRAASLAYLGKEPGRLTTAEAALLVALPQAPESRRPAA